MIKEAIENIIAGQELSYAEAQTAMTEALTGESSQNQNAAFLAALSARPVTAASAAGIAGCAAALREHPDVKYINMTDKMLGPGSIVPRLKALAESGGISGDADRDTGFAAELIAAGRF